MRRSREGLQHEARQELGDSYRDTFSSFQREARRELGLFEVELDENLVILIETPFWNFQHGTRRELGRFEVELGEKVVLFEISRNPYLSTFSCGFAQKVVLLFAARMALFGDF